MYGVAEIRKQALGNYVILRMAGSAANAMLLSPTKEHLNKGPPLLDIWRGVWGRVHELTPRGRSPLLVHVSLVGDARGQ